MREWKDALKEHKQAILDKGYKEEQLLGIFLYGSQNYGCATENSDIDTKAIYVPSFEELCFNNPLSKEIHTENGEHCEIKDIREMVKNFQKQNINFLEILFTNKCWVNARFRDLWDKYFYRHREEIAHYNPKKMLDSICGQAIHTLKQIPLHKDGKLYFNDTLVANTIGVTDISCGKKYANGLRLSYFLDSCIFAEESFETSIKPDEEYLKLIMDYKNGKMLVTPLAVEILLKHFEEMKEKATKKSSILAGAVDETAALMQEGAMKLIEEVIYDKKL